MFIFLTLVALALLGIACRRMLAQDRRAAGRTSPLVSRLIWIIYLSYTALVAWTAWRNVWPLPFEHPSLRALGLVLLLGGLALFGAGLSAFASLARATGCDSSRLTRTGVYRWTRNPQNIGWALGLFGFAMLGQSGLALLLAFGFWILFRVFLPAEERHLERLFGEDWRSYAASTPRLFGLPARDRASSDVEIGAA